MRSTVETLLLAGVTPILMSQVPNHGKILDGCQVPVYVFSTERVAERCHGVSRVLAVSRMAWIDQEISDIGREYNVPVVIPTEYFCHSYNHAHCRTLVGNTLLSKDGSHLTKYGSIFLAKEWEKSGGVPFVKQ